METGYLIPVFSTIQPKESGPASEGFLLLHGRMRSMILHYSCCTILSTRPRRFLYYFEI